MKILIIQASPRKNGNTSIISQIITQKFKKIDDIDVETVCLSDLNISFCKGCCNCLTVGEDYCPNKNDDRKMLEEKILSANGVIFVTPVYAMNMPAVMKNFMDRFAFTMHRPRFFKQYTMIVGVTGAVGLKETIKSISQIKYSGFNIVQTLGITAQNPLENVALTDEKKIKNIEQSIEKFYKTLKSERAIEPSFMNLLSFRFQQKYFCKLNPSKSADWKYFNQQGWFNPKCNYYTENVKIPFYKKVFQKLIYMLP